MGTCSIKRFVFTIAVVAALAFAGGRAPAVGRGPSKRSCRGRPPAQPVTPDAVTQQIARNQRQDVPLHRSRRNDHVARPAQGKPTCRMFFTAFTLDGVDPSTRPVTFFYNGGPGSSTIWLRMGSFGPMRVAIGDASVGRPTRRSNWCKTSTRYSIAATWYSSTLPEPDSAGSSVPASPTDFYGVDQDMRAFTQFVSRYVSTYGRWNSPKFLFGESYGTPRTAVLVNNLQRQGIGINGVVLLVVDPRLQPRLGHQFHAGGDRRRRLGLPALPPDRGGVIVVSQRCCPGPQTTLQKLLPASRAVRDGRVSQRAGTGRELRRRRTTTSSRSCTSIPGFRRSTSATSNLRIPYWRYMTELLRNSGKRSAGTTLVTCRIRSTG